MPRYRLKSNLNVRVRTELIERARNAREALMRRKPAVDLTVTEMAEQGLSMVVESLEKEFNHGRPFSQRQERLKWAPPKEEAANGKS